MRWAAYRGVFEPPLSIKGKLVVTQNNIVKFAEPWPFEFKFREDDFRLDLGPPYRTYNPDSQSQRGRGLHVVVWRILAGFPGISPVDVSMEAQPISMGNSRRSRPQKRYRLPAPKKPSPSPASAAAPAPTSSTTIFRFQLTNASAGERCA